MRVSRQQAEENRQTVIDVASRLFREHGFDGIGLKDLMAGAGLTQGAFYKQFESKDDLAAQASKRALESAFSTWSAVGESNPQDPFGAMVAYYLSMGHRALRGDGCPIVALGSDAARQSDDVKAAFQAGIEKYLELLGRWIGDAGDTQFSDKAISILSTMIGAMVLSRAVNDEQMSRRFLEAAAESVRSSTEPAQQPGRRL
jgi:TetR/AcrR family transcriptional repressor of nem operon